MTIDNAKKKRAELKMLSRNLYLGADFNLLFPPRTTLSLAQVVANFYRAVEDTHYEERVQVLAQEIACRNADVVCLQEVYDYQLPKHRLQLDFLAMLNQELLKHNAHYSIAAKTVATEVILPIAWNEIEGSLVIRDQLVILVREGIPHDQELSARYDASVDLVLPNDKHVEARLLTVRRAFNRTTIRWNGELVHIGNTHLESIDDDVQFNQAKELYNVFSKDVDSVLIAGDMNAKPDSDTYNWFVNSEKAYQDPFAKKDINTWGASPMLNDEYIDLRERIDHIFHRGRVSPKGAQVFGISRQERTHPSSLWPSDHAGLMGVYTI